MARGWESKSVEEQMEDASQEPQEAATDGLVSDEAKREANRRRAELERQKQALNLQRENILSQRTSSPVRRAALAAALNQIDAQLSALK
jgi:hypothetical protein